MRGFVFSSPHFFSLIRRAFWAGLGLLLFLGWLLPAPLQEAADPGLAPNPAKSAWFLLWTQELVSYSRELAYLIAALALLFLLLPWLPGTPPAEKARWFSREQWPATILTLLVFFGIVALTVVALFFRGENWQLVSPF